MKIRSLVNNLAVILALVAVPLVLFLFARGLTAKEYAGVAFTLILLFGAFNLFMVFLDSRRRKNDDR